MWLGSAALALCALLVLALSIVSYRNTIAPGGIVIHHSAVPIPYGATTVDSELLDQIHERRGFSTFYWGRIYHIGYHYIILPDGTVQRGRPERCQGAHARGYNSFIGICLVGEFDKSSNPTGEKGPAEPTQAQMDALVKLIRDLRERYQIPSYAIYPHNRLNPGTECPGSDFPFEELRARLGLDP